MKGRQAEAGQALLLALVVLVLSLTALALLAAALARGQRSVRDEARELQLIALADAALAEALAHLAQDRYHRGLGERELGDGWIASRVEPLAGDRVRVVVTARYGGASRAAEAQVRLTLAGPRVVAWRVLPPSARHLLEEP